MKVKSKYESYILSVEEALLECMNVNIAYDRLGAIEELQADVIEIKQTLARFMAMHIKTVEALNEVAGWGKFQEVGVQEEE